MNLNNRISSSSFSNVTMFVNTHLVRQDITKRTDDPKYLSYYCVKNITIKHNNINRVVKFESRQTVKSLSKSLANVGIAANETIGKNIRKRIKAATTHISNETGFTEIMTDFHSAIETSGNVSRVWIVDAKMSSRANYGRAYATIICVQAAQQENKIVYDTFKEVIADRDGIGRFFAPSVKAGTTMTHHLTNMNKIENRGGARIKSKLKLDYTPQENVDVVNETIDVVNDLSGTVNETVDVVNRLMAIVDELRSEIALNKVSHTTRPYHAANSKDFQDPQDQAIRKPERNMSYMQSSFRRRCSEESSGSRSRAGWAKCWQGQRTSL